MSDFLKLLYALALGALCSAVVNAWVVRLGSHEPTPAPVSCPPPPSCDAAWARADVCLDLLDDCRGAVRACATRGVR